MREIKFRIWDKEKNRWAQVMNLLLTREGEEKYYSISDRDDRFIVQQFTGLKDKNGKSVFEGDVLKRIDGSILVIKSEMEYNCGCCDWVYGWAMCPKAKDCEVIGNVCESPELLK